jgi:hypothetical protein
MEPIISPQSRYQGKYTPSVPCSLLVFVFAQSEYANEQHKLLSTSVPNWRKPLFLAIYMKMPFRNKKCLSPCACFENRGCKPLREPHMKEIRISALGLLLGLGLLILNAFGASNPTSPGKTTRPDTITRHISILKSGKAQDKAAAAYWLGQQHVAAASAVQSLVDLLGDTNEVDPIRYRSNPFPGKMTVGEEAAAALVNIGHPSIDALIRVLRNSPLAEARKNAAWALGALHDTGATTQI